MEDIESIFAAKSIQKDVSHPSLVKKSPAESSAGMHSTAYTHTILDGGETWKPQLHQLSHRQVLGQSWRNRDELRRPATTTGIAATAL